MISAGAQIIHLLVNDRHTDSLVSSPGYVWVMSRLVLLELTVPSDAMLAKAYTMCEKLDTGMSLGAKILRSRGSHRHQHGRIFWSGHR